MTSRTMADKAIKNDEMKREQMNQIGTNDSNVMLETAKRRLHWYATEASEEEFDEEDVALMVKVVEKLEPQPAVEIQESEKELERFRAYVNLYLEDEERRTAKHLVKEDEGKAVEGMLPEKTTKGKKISRPHGFRGKALAVAAAAACILLVILIGGFGDVVNADEDTGFFHWLKWDNEGMIAITSPESNKMGTEEANIKEYASIEELPEEYHQYVIDKKSISLLQEYELKKFVCTEKTISKKLSEVFQFPEEGKEVKMGIVFYTDSNVITVERLADYEILDTGFYKEHKQDVFVKEGEKGKIEYMVLFYDSNKKYFVYGNEDVEFLKAVSEQYMDFIFD